MKLKYRLCIIVISILVVIVAAISIILLNRASSLQMAAARTSQRRLAAEQARVIQIHYEAYLRTAHILADTLADFDKSDAGGQRYRFDQFMESILQSEERLVAIFVVFKPNVIDPGMDAVFAGLPGNTAAGQWANRYTRQSGKIEHLTFDRVDLIMGELNGPSSRQDLMNEPVPLTVAGKKTHVVQITVPVIHRKTNEVVGRVGLDIDMAFNQPVVDNILKDPELTDISAMTIYAHEGLIVASYAEEHIGRDIKDAQGVFFGKHIEDAKEAVTWGNERRYTLFSQVLKKDLEVILYPVYIGQTGASWSIMVGTEMDIVLKDVNALTVFTIILGFAAAIVAAVLIFLVAVSITKPIVNVAFTLKDISEGEGDLTKTVHVNSKDEIGDLARYFNATLEKIRVLVVIIKKESIVLFDIGNELASNMNQTASAINEITANIQSIKGRVINQSASVTEANAIMDQITVNIDKLKGHVDRQGESVAQSSSAIEEMLANIQSVTQTLVKNTSNVKDLLEASEVGKSGLEEVASDIRAIAQESEGLLEINAVMENIASQTNLLSMNAAIEAAHAGEAGKGFAVVADEIRKLAENSGEQSKTISTVLKKIKDSIDKITRSTDSVLNKFEAIDGGVRTVSDQEENILNAMEEQSVGSKQILAAIGQLNEVTQIVKSGSEEMLEGSRQVMAESKNLELVTQEISNGMNEMATGADQINVAVNRVNTISGQNKENINILVQEVAKFKVE
ncbi:MAG: methyl-accepting chemotaxis protein [Treponema sp.]|jgi:methyl-accepting chemotaxis protein|nr:methyl-accepting chemotaxis protein [Treponema sp.]